MTTRAIVPNGDGEGSLGTSTAKWGAIYSSDPASGENSGQVPTTAWVQKLVAEGVLPGTVTAFEDGFPVNKNTGLVNRGWHLCDGTNGTPDLRGRMILGSSDSHAAGSTGGEESVTLTEAQLPKLSGSFEVRSFNVNSNLVDIYKQGIVSVNSNAGALWTGSAAATSSVASVKNSVVTVSFGGNQPHNNMPPYYTLAFIMKL